MHHLPSLFSFFYAVPNPVTMDALATLFAVRNSVCFRDIVFKMFSAVSNRFKYHQNAYFRDIAPGSYTSCTSDLIIW